MSKARHKYRYPVEWTPEHVHAFKLGYAKGYVAGRRSSGTFTRPVPKQKAEKQPKPTWRLRFWRVIFGV